MSIETLRAGVETIRPFVPAKDFALSNRFYEALGFEAQRLGPDLTLMRIGAYTFLLQSHYVQTYAENFAMHMIVDDVDAWWAHIESLEFEKNFGITWKPRPPQLQSWGLIVAFFADPAGVLWHVAQRPKQPAPA